MNEQLKKELITQVDKVCAHKHTGDVFEDLVWLKAFEYRSQALGLLIQNESKILEEVEKTKKEINGIKTQYTKDEFKKLQTCMSLLDRCYQNMGFCDLIGELSTMIGMLNKSTGQFFTPYHIARLMAEITGIGTSNEEDHRSMMDPHCGAGTMLVAYADTMQRHGIPLEETFYTGADIDRFCVVMTYVQLCEFGLAGVVHWSDSIKNEIWESWFTPAALRTS